jgi:hypothetical protein
MVEDLMTNLFFRLAALPSIDESFYNGVDNDFLFSAVSSEPAEPPILLN